MKISSGRTRLTWNQRCFGCMLPSFMGVMLFCVIPFIRVIYYSFVKSQFDFQFVGLNHYIETWCNPYFQLALKNSMLFLGRNMPVLMALSILLSILFAFVIKKNTWISTAFIMPMVIPTASIVVIWKFLFHKMDGTLPMDLLFIWKNIGICIILQTSAFASIPDDIYDAAKIDGANGVNTHLFLSIPMAAKTILYTLLLSIMNSYKIFKESYLYYGAEYPPDYAYTLQFYMNNHFLKLDYQSLATSSVYVGVLSLLFIAIGFKLIERYTV